nr:MAG TPA: hypothetical protein [Caudoviricetes sp.]
MRAKLAHSSNGGRPRLHRASFIRLTCGCITALPKSASRSSSTSCTLISWPT